MATIDERAVISAYQNLKPEQKERFFQGKEAQAKKVIGSLTYLLGSHCNYDQLLDLYITAAVRVIMGFENERINITVKMRHSDIVPEAKALTVIECIRRITENYAFIDKANSPEMKAYMQFFDSQNDESFNVNKKRLNDALENSGFGTDPDNPIFAHSADGSYSYLNLLYTSENIPLTWKRVCSMEVESSRDPLDKYELMLPDGTVFVTVYVNMYSRENSAYCPRGLRADGLKELPMTTPIQTRTVPEETEELSEEDEYLAFLQNYSKDSSTPNNESKNKGGTERSSSRDAGHKNEEKTSKNPQPAEPDEVLSESTTPILQGNLPVMVGKSSILKKKNGEIYAICSFLPITEKSIRAMQVDFLCYDVWHESLEPVERFQYNDLRTSREAYFGSDILIPLSDPNTRTIEAVVSRVMFADGTLLQRAGENIGLPALELLDNHFANKSLSTEYKTLTYKNIKYTPVKAGAFWRCTCGAVNRADEAKCHKCADSAEILFKKLDESLLQSSIDEKKRLQREKEERDRIAREEARKKAEEERRAREQRAAEEARLRAEQKKRRNKRIAIASAVLAAIAVIVYFVGWQIIPASKYKAADELLSAGDREGAYAAFLDLGKFRDSSDRAYAIKYEDAKTAFDKGDYQAAFELFSSISDYSDSATQANESVYRRATLLMEAGSYTEAAELFESIKGYRDSTTQGTKCRNERAYIEASALFEKGKYKEAAELFESIKQYRDSSELMIQTYYLYAQELIENEKPHEAYLILSSKVNQGDQGYEDSIDLANTIEYEYAATCFKEGKYVEAAESFANLGEYKDSASRCLEAKYQHGLELIANGSYDEAENLFTTLGDYKDSAKQINESIYQHGLALIEAKKYDDAITVLSRLKNYRDCARQLNEAKYQKALQLMSQKKYQDAEKIFEELGSYSDSTKQLKECKYQRALGLVKDKKYTQAVTIFKDLGNYSDSIEQWKAAMYAYVLAHKNNTDKTTYEYLTVLKKYNYKSSSSYYESLYAWKATIVINTSETDKTTKKTSVSTYDTIYCHFTLDGGPPGEVVALKAVGYWPWGGSSTVKWNGDNEWRRGNSGWCSWWLNDPSSSSAKGTFTFKLYVGSTLIGEASVRFT